MRIGVFTSGGDAPGMNACVRAVIRSAVSKGHEVVGIRRGYQGLIEEDFFRQADGEPLMRLRSVSNILHLGGTILGTSRSQLFRTEEGVRQAADALRKHRIDALIPIGGDGTFHGAVDSGRALGRADRRLPRHDRQRPAGHRLHDRLRHGGPHGGRCGRQAPRHGREPRAAVPGRGDGPAQRIHRPLDRPGRRGRGGGVARNPHRRAAGRQAAQVPQGAGQKVDHGRRGRRRRTGRGHRARQDAPRRPAARSTPG